MGETPLHKLFNTPGFFTDPERSESRLVSLLAAGVHPDELAMRGDSPLYRLIKLQADYQRTELSEEPIAKSRQLTMRLVRHLARYNAFLDQRNYSDSRTPLAAACSSGFAELVDYLLANGANAKYIDHQDNSLLHYAARHMNSGIVGKLLQHGADPSLLDRNRRTALYIAMGCLANLHPDCELLAATIGHIDYSHPVDGSTPLHWAVTLPLLPERVHWWTQTLLRHGADPDLKNRQGTTPMHYALRRLDVFPQVFGLMHERSRADIDEIRLTRYGLSAVTFAIVVRQSTEDARTLIKEFGFDPYDTDGQDLRGCDIIDGWLDEVKAIRYDRFTNMHDLLSDRDKLGVYTRSEAFARATIDSPSFKRDHPDIIPLLRRMYDKAKKRRDLIETAMERMCACNVKLPTSCIELILVRLDDADLRTIAEL